MVHFEPEPPVPQVIVFKFVFYVLLLFSVVGSKAATSAMPVPEVNKRHNKVAANAECNQKQRVQCHRLHAHWNWNKNNPMCQTIQFQIQSSLTADCGVDFFLV